MWLQPEEVYYAETTLTSDFRFKFMMQKKEKDRIPKEKKIMSPCILLRTFRMFKNYILENWIILNFEPVLKLKNLETFMEMSNLKKIYNLKKFEMETLCNLLVDEYSAQLTATKKSLSFHTSNLVIPGPRMLSLLTSGHGVYQECNQTLGEEEEEVEPIMLKLLIYCWYFHTEWNRTLLKKRLP